MGEGIERRWGRGAGWSRSRQCGVEEVVGLEERGICREGERNFIHTNLSEDDANNNEEVVENGEDDVDSGNDTPVAHRE